MGVEPTPSAWKAEVLPLNYTRIKENWWRGKDSNLRRLSRQIYSLIPLTAREPLRKEFIIFTYTPIPVKANIKLFCSMQAIHDHIQLASQNLRQKIHHFRYGFCQQLLIML